MALSANRELDRFVDQELRSYRVAASTHVYKGGFVGLNSSGYARGLVASDACVGVAYEESDNSSGSNGDKSVRVFTMSDFQHTLSGAAITDIGRAVYASADDTITFDPSGNSFVGYVQDYLDTAKIILRFQGIGPIGWAQIDHHTSAVTLTAAQSGTVHTNLGASGAVTVTLPQSPPEGTQFKFVCMADQELRIDPGAAGGIYIKGAKQTDDKYVSITDIADFIHLIADGNGDWVAVASISGADGDISVEV